ncbi:hypothetical protein BST81_06285 [Leptolyngbya sp. 'hensonii']|nr:hypothetical protein BST81_06285 [Leptolyngbya sp. 'hensonii']
MRGWSAFLWAILLLAGSCWLAASPAQAQVNQRSMFESITLTIGPRLSPDPTELRGVGGGTVPAPEVAGRSETTNGPCVGFVGTKPSHTLILTSFLNYLSLQVQAPEDTTLVIKGPGGTWCNDDFRGKNPGIAGQWLPGTYQIWIGSYSKTNLHPYILRLTQKR